MDFSLKQALEVMIAMLVVALVFMVTTYLLKNNGSKITSTNSDIWKVVNAVEKKSEQLDAKPQPLKSYTGYLVNKNNDYIFRSKDQYDDHNFGQPFANFNLHDDNSELKMPNGGKVRVTFDASTTAPGSHIYLYVVFDSRDYSGNLIGHSDYSSDIQLTSSQWKTYTVELNLSHYGGEKERNIKSITFGNSYNDFSSDMAHWDFRNVRLEQM